MGSRPQSDDTFEIEQRTMDVCRKSTPPEEVRRLSRFSLVTQLASAGLREWHARGPVTIKCRR